MKRILVIMLVTACMTCLPCIIFDIYLVFDDSFTEHYEFFVGSALINLFYFAFVFTMVKYGSDSANTIFHTSSNQSLS